jgi:His-Xaa-Ser system protein HxsD
VIERVIAFERSNHSADAIQRAIYKFTDRLSCDLRTDGSEYRCHLHITQEAADADGIVSEFRNEVLDETLRERIRDETSEFRNLILALAFSNTGLVADDEQD